MFLYVSYGFAALFLPADCTVTAGKTSLDSVAWRSRIKKFFQGGSVMSPVLLHGACFSFCSVFTS